MSLTPHEYTRDFATYLVTSICFFVVFGVSIVQAIRLYRLNQFSGNRGAILLSLAGASFMAIADSFSRFLVIALVSPVVMCSYPYVLVWYFIFTAYILNLDMWIRVYTKVSRGGPQFVRNCRIAFVVLNVFLLAVLLAVAHLWDVETTLPDALYVTALMLTAVVISALFTAYGAKIANRLSAGLKMQVSEYKLNSKSEERTHKRDKHLYKVTRSVVILSATCLSGALLALIAKLLLIFVDYDDMQAIVEAVQVIFELSMITEMLFIVKPKKQKEILSDRISSAYSDTPTGGYYSEGLHSTASSDSMVSLKRTSSTK